MGNAPEGSPRSIAAFAGTEWLNEAAGRVASGSMPVSLIGGASDVCEPAAGKRPSLDSGPGTTGRAIAIGHYTWAVVRSD